MADPAAFQAHRVVADAMVFLVAEQLDDDWHDMVMQALDDALKLATPTGFPAVDQLVEAGRALVQAEAALRANPRTRNSLDLVAARMRAGTVMMNFARARLAKSYEGLTGAALTAPNPPLAGEPR